MERGGLREGERRGVTPYTVRTVQSIRSRVESRRVESRVVEGGRKSIQITLLHFLGKSDYYAKPWVNRELYFNFSKVCRHLGYGVGQLLNDLMFSWLNYASQHEGDVKLTININQYVDQSVNIVNLEQKVMLIRLNDLLRKIEEGISRKANVDYLRALRERLLEAARRLKQADEETASRVVEALSRIDQYIEQSKGR